MTKTEIKSIEKREEALNYYTFALLILAAFAVGIYAVLFFANISPFGEDVWGHLYNADYMYRSILQGNFYPVYDLSWYNGIETFRYWGPLFSYLFSIPLFITGGNVLMSYRLFISMMIFVGGIPWIVMGNRSGKRIFGSVMSLLWFMLPENIHIICAFGNLPQAVSIMFMGYILMFMRSFLVDKKNRSAAGLVVTMCLITVSYLTSAIVVSVSVAVFLIIDAFFNHDNILRKISALFYVLLGFLLMGVWFVPTVMSGVTLSGKYIATVDESLATSIFVSLNPFERFDGDGISFYFGLSFVVLAIFSLIASDRKNKAGFIFLLLALFSTSETGYSLISHLPKGATFWMEPYTPFAYGLMLYSFFEWTTIKKKFAAVYAAVLILDAMPFFSAYVNGYEISGTVVEANEILADISDNRAGIVDLNSMRLYPSSSVIDGDTNYSFGWSWQSSGTSDNIKTITDALVNRRYYYVFDRCVELCDDTVAIPKFYVNTYNYDELIEAAAASGYELKQETSDFYFFKLTSAPEDGVFGTVTDYEGIAIGEYSADMTAMYPKFCVGESNYIDDYTVEELSSYKSIFLTGFDYHDSEAAESIVSEVAAAGTRIVIDAAHLPADKSTNNEIFMGVAASKVEFIKQYPTLHINGRSVVAKDFSGANSTFDTCYISGVDNVLGTTTLGTNELTILGTNNDAPNVYFVAINMMYEALDTDDDALLTVLDELLLIDHNDIPSREIVPISVSYADNVLTITAPRDDVNSGLTWTPGMKYRSASGEVSHRLNLVTVSSGTTEIQLNYAYLENGLIVTYIGIFLGAAYTELARRYRRKSLHVDKSESDKADDNTDNFVPG